MRGPCHAGDAQKATEKCQAAAELLVSEGPLKDLLLELVSWIRRGDKMSQSLQTALAGSMATAARGFQHNAEVRARVAEVIAGWASLKSGDVPEDGKAALAEFLKVSEGASTEDSALHSFLALRKAMSSLEGGSEFEFDTDVAEVEVLKDSGNSIAMEWTSVLEAPALLATCLSEDGSFESVFEQAFSLAWDDLLGRLSLQPMRPANDIAGVSPTDGKGAIKALVDVASVGGAKDIAMQLPLDIGRRITGPCLELPRLLASLWHSVHGEEPVEVSLTNVVRTKTSVSASCEQVCPMLELCGEIHMAMALMAHMHNTLLGRAICGQECRAEAQSAVMALDAASVAVADACQRVEAESGAKSAIPWTPAFAEMQHWAGAFALVVSVVKRSIVGEFVSAVGSKSEKLLELVPKYSHAVNDTAYSRRLAAKLLLENPAREQISAECASLHTMIANASGLYATFGLGSKLEEDDNFGDPLVAATSVFQSAKACVSVIAAVNVVQKLEGDQQRRSAEVILGKPGVVSALPAALLAELQAVAMARAPKKKAGRTPVT